MLLQLLAKTLLFQFQNKTRICDAKLNPVYVISNIYLNVYFKKHCERFLKISGARNKTHSFTSGVGMTSLPKIAFRVQTEKF